LGGGKGKDHLGKVEKPWVSKDTLRESIVKKKGTSKSRVEKNFAKYLEEQIGERYSSNIPGERRGRHGSFE